MHPKTAVLLINLGTPDSPSPKDVKRYLTEFLTDKYVMDIPWLWRQLLVRGYIIPKRYRQSATSYEKIWTEEGSPLLVYSQSVKEKLQQVLGTNYLVELAMRYQNPSMEEGIAKLLREDLKELIVFPLFPQYASATTGSVYQRLMELLKSSQKKIPPITFVNHFFDHPAFIEAFYKAGKNYSLADYDHILFSFHGLPQRQIKKADKQGNCLVKKECCHPISSRNDSCYSAHCFATAHAIAARLHIPANQYTLCFQSRLGKEPWLQPYASETIKELAEQGKKKILVFCPSFVCDCLETIYEFGFEYQAEFIKAGGEKLELVAGLNDRPFWVEALKTMIISKSIQKAS